MHYEEIELNFDASCQQIIGLESKILWEARSTPTLGNALEIGIDQISARCIWRFGHTN
jgi:hypothetical protein